MPTQDTQSTKPRLTRIGIGTALYLVFTLAAAAASREVGPQLLGALILVGAATISLWLLPLVRTGRGRYLGIMIAMGAVPLLFALVAPGWEDLPEFMLTMSWMFLWPPLYVPSAGARGSCGRPELASLGFWFLITGPLLGGVFLLMTAIL